MRAKIKTLNYFWMWKAVVVLRLLRLLENCSVAAVALVLHLRGEDDDSCDDGDGGHETRIEMTTIKGARMMTTIVTRTRRALVNGDVSENEKDNKKWRLKSTVTRMRRI